MDKDWHVKVVARTQVPVVQSVWKTAKDRQVQSTIQMLDVLVGLQTDDSRIGTETRGENEEGRNIPGRGQDIKGGDQQEEQKKRKEKEKKIRVTTKNETHWV